MLLQNFYQQRDAQEAADNAEKETAKHLKKKKVSPPVKLFPNPLRLTVVNLLAKVNLLAVVTLLAIVNLLAIFLLNFVQLKSYCQIYEILVF
jgi:hypothetical protein